jgi:[ribosomal protein S5]-alanine N-acetyltransferase
MKEKSGITVRDAVGDDFVQQLNYFQNSTNEYFLDLGTDPKAVRAMPPVNFDDLEKRSMLPPQERPAHTLAIELDGRLIGMVGIRGIKFGETAEIHAHIFDIKDRHRGYIARAFQKILERIFELFELRLIVCEPTTTNLPVNAFLQKLGLEIKSTYVTPAGGILRERTANRYEITHEFFEKLRD